LEAYFNAHLEAYSGFEVGHLTKSIKTLLMYNVWISFWTMDLKSLSYSYQLRICIQYSWIEVTIWNLSKEL